MRSRFLLALLFGLLTLSGAVGARADTTAPAGSIGIRLLDAPTNRENDPRARLYIVDHLAPGTTIHRRVEISNGTSDPLTIPVYAAAATVAGDTFRFADGHDGNELTRWTTVEPASLTVQPNRSAIAAVTIAVPAAASAGERYGVVWAESPPAKSSSGGISAVNRVGIRMYLSVGPGGEPPSDFTITALQARRAPTGEPVVAAIVHNTGQRALDLSGQLRLSNGPAGLAAGPFQAKLGSTLAIGATEPVLVSLDKAVPAGPWTADIKLTTGLVEHAATATITFPKSGVGARVSTTSGGKSKGVFIAVGSVLLLVVIAAAWWLLRRRSRRSAVLGT